MRVTPLNLAFAFLALCGNGHAGPCKPKSTSAALDGPSSTQGVTSASAQGTTSASNAVSTTTEEDSAVEPLTSYSSIISGPVSSIITTTSDALLSHLTELSASSETIETSTSMTAETSATLTSTTELSTEFPTSSDVPTSTTTAEPAPSGLFLNPSFEEPSIDGEFDVTPWTLRNGPSSTANINSGLARTGSHSAYWSITGAEQNGGTIKQEVSLADSHFYTLSYWWYIDEAVQPQNLQSCYIFIEQEAIDGETSSFPNFMALPSTLPLKTWTKQEFQFNSVNISPAYMIFNVLCTDNAGTGLKVAIDDVQLLY